MKAESRKTVGLNEIHKIPESEEKHMWLQELEPVKIDPPRSWSGVAKSLLTARNNLLAVWPKRSYKAMTFSMSLLNQKYFLCNSPDTVRRIFLEEHDNYDKKSVFMRNALEPLLGDGLFVSDGALWKERRAHCAPAFENALLPDFAAVMTECSAELTEQWETLPDGCEVDMLNEMAKLTAKIIGRTIFGDETTDGEAAQVVSGFTEYQRNIEHLKISDFTGVQYLRWITNPLKKHRSQQAIAEVHEVIDRIISRQKIQKKSARFNLISYLLADSTKQNETKCPMDLVAARNEAIVMFMAGHETTANSLAWTWYLLNHSPRVGAKLRQELDSVLGGRHATLDDVVNLPYTRAVFEESLRLYPPVPVLTRESREEDVIRKKQVAKGTIMLVVPWLLHRHELFWESPNQFIPERFLGETRPDKFIYLPFSVGRRVCLGLRFGLSEGIICLANLAQRFEASLKPEHEVEIECRLTLRPKGGLPMQLKRRKECQN